jgi:thiol-disulfide isomerase/thioredoxin
MIIRSVLRALASLVLCYAAAAAQAGAPQAGDSPPSYVGKNLDGDKVELGKYAGKAVVISFWATWCPYCLKELPVMHGIQKAAKGRVHVIAINTEDRDTFRRVTRALRQLDIEMAYDPDEEAQKAFGVSGIPHMVVIGRDGKIVRVFRGYDESSLPDIAAAINRATGAAEAANAAGRD